MKEKLLEQLNDLAKENNLYIVGAGKCGTILGEWMNRNKVKWSGYLDRKKSGESLNGKEIYDTFSPKNKKDHFIISSFYLHDEMKDDLLKQSVSVEQITAIDYDLFFEIYGEISDWGKYTNKIKRFCGYHKNDKRCFVIGNGPSLTIEDLEKLQGEISFASNAIYAVYGSTKWRPNYYFMGDPAFANAIGKSSESLKTSILDCDAAFISVLVEGYKFRDNDEFQNIYYMRRGEKIDEVTKLPCFSEDCSEVVYASSTITYVLLQMAVYMGFKEIYLLGMDFTFSNEQYRDNSVKSRNISNHMDLIEKECQKFTKAVENRVGYSYLAYIDMQRDGYIAAKRYADEHGIKIYNATRGGKLEVFERVNFDTLFG